MIDAHLFALFLAASLVLALMPGPCMLYVAGRAIAGGRAEGLASTLGTGLGGLVHVVAAAVGVSALVMASATLFGALKLAGALYLAWLGIRTWREAGRPAAPDDAAPARGAFREGVLVEATNPKTAAFFLAFLPQFVSPAQGHVAQQIVLLGATSVALNTLADFAVALAAGQVRALLLGRPALLRRFRQASGAMFVALGAGLLLTRRPAP